MFLNRLPLLIRKFGKITSLHFFMLIIHNDIINCRWGKKIQSITNDTRGSYFENYGGTYSTFAIAISETTYL